MLTKKFSLFLSVAILLIFCSSCFGIPSLNFNDNPGPPGEVVFISDRIEDTLQLFTMELNGFNQQYLPTTEFLKAGVSTDRGHSLVAFVDVLDAGDVARQFSGRLLTGDLNTGNIEVLLDDAGMRYCNISGDGRKVVYMLYDGEQGINYTGGIGTDGSDNHIIAGDANTDSLLPNINNDGSKTAYTLWSQVQPEGKQARQNFDGIYESDWDGSNRRQLVEDAETQANYSPAYSPDGSKLAFVTLDLDLHAYLIRVIDLVNPGGPLTIFQSDDAISGLHYSADGSKLLFSMVPSGDQITGNGKKILDTIKNNRKPGNPRIGSVDSGTGENLYYLTIGESFDAFDIYYISAK
ncbi:MAG: hypothetical protein M1269_11425 [Chloroflexi bacterium]|nr:hypothetical protein [Chloroflexota bacterium]